MDISCNENSTSTNFAKRDPNIFGDDRVIENLLKDEIRYMPTCNYFLEVQSEIRPYMRNVVGTWMMEVGLIFARFRIFANCFDFDCCRFVRSKCAKSKSFPWPSITWIVFCVCVPSNVNNFSFWGPLVYFWLPKFAAAHSCP